MPVPRIDAGVDRDRLRLCPLWGSPSGALAVAGLMASCGSRVPSIESPTLLTAEFVLGSEVRSGVVEGLSEIKS